jgi:hypothetical protein
MDTSSNINKLLTNYTPEQVNLPARKNTPEQVNLPARKDTPEYKDLSETINPATFIEHPSTVIEHPTEPVKKSPIFIEYPSEPVKNPPASMGKILTLILGVIIILLICYIIYTYYYSSTSAFQSNPNALEPATKLLVAYHMARDPLYTPLNTYARPPTHMECYIDPNDMPPSMRKALKASFSKPEQFIGMSQPLSLQTQLLASSHEASAPAIGAALLPAPKKKPILLGKEWFADAEKKALLKQLEQKPAKKKEAYESKMENPALTKLLYGIPQ